jgi:hypothetical protein
MSEIVALIFFFSPSQEGRAQRCGEDNKRTDEDSQNEHRFAWDNQHRIA